MKLLGLLMIIVLAGCVSALSFSDVNVTDFNAGTYNNTFHNGTSLILAGANSSGTFTSRIFDSGSYARWTLFNQSFANVGKEYFFALDNNRNVFRSENNGTSWIDVTTTGYVQDADGFVMNSTGAFFIVSDDKKVYGSIDSGGNWSVLNSTVQFADLPRGLTIDENNVLYAIARGRRIYTSVDSGVSWSLINDTFTSGTTNTQRCIFYFNGSLYTFDDASAVFRSTNSGVSWTMINASFAGPHCFSMTTNATGAFIVAADNQRVYGSINQGVSWTQLTAPIVFANDVNAITTDLSNNLYASVRQGRFYTSGDSGQNWTLINDTYSSANTGNQYGVLYAPIRSNVTFQVRNCSSSDCADGTFIGPDGTGNTRYTADSNIDLTGRYFQYKVFQLTNERSFSSFLYNTTVQYSLVDVMPPQSGLMQTDAPSVYVAQPSNFTITWADASGIDQVFLESNFSGASANYTMYALGGDVYGFNASLPAGTFFWRSYANDTFGNMNVSDTNTLTVEKAGNAVDIYLDGTSQNTSVVYGTLTNASASAAYGEVSLLRDGVNVGSSEVGILSATSGGYNYTVFANGNQNYSANASTIYLFVSRANASMQLLLNGDAHDTSIVYGSLSNASASENNSGDNDVSYDLYLNTVIVSSGSSVSESSLLAAGTYVYSYNSSEGENYTAGGRTVTLSVTQAAPLLNMLLNGVASDVSTTLDTNVTINASLVNPHGLANVYENGVLVDSSGSYFVTKQYSSLGVVVWNISFTGNQNYSSSSTSYTVSVTDSDTPQFSNLHVNPASAFYNASAPYVFSVTWTDNVALSDVVVQIDGVNHSYSAGEVTRLGDVYDITVAGLSAGDHTYVWYANDSSGNGASTPVQAYSIHQANTTVTITISGDVVYGTETNVSCGADSAEVNVSLFLDGVAVSNPHQVTLAGGLHTYACNASSSQNYSSSHTSSTISVARAPSSLHLFLNGAASDLSLSNIGNVTLTSSLDVPVVGEVNITVNSLGVAYGSSPLETVLEFNSTGSYLVAASYGGSENYSSNEVSFVVSVGSSSRETGEGSRASFEVAGPEQVRLKTGESTNVVVRANNNGASTLTRCRVYSAGVHSSFLSTSEEQDISSGESATFDATLRAPLVAGSYSVQFRVACVELSRSGTISLQVSEVSGPAGSQAPAPVQAAPHGDTSVQQRRGISGLSISSLLSSERIGDVTANVLLALSAFLLAYLIYRTRILMERVIVRKRLAGH